MKKTEFIDKVKIALERGFGIDVGVEIPGNKNLERIRNHPEDVENKLNYYISVYDDNMHHVNSNVIRIVDVKHTHVGVFSFTTKNNEMM